MNKEVRPSRSGTNQTFEVWETSKVSRHQPYPAYKPSGVAWLGDIPAHWNKTVIKRLAKHGYRKFIDGDWIESPYITNDGVRLLQTGNIGIGEFKEQGFRYISEETFDELKCTEISPGDVLICRLAEPVGRACVAPDLGVRMITSVDVCILKLSDDFDTRFVVYFLSSDLYLSWMQALCRGGTRDRVSRSMLGAIEFVAPPLPEQRAIAAYLDRETARLDALIAKKERLIELLQEKRTTLISHAVTRGLDANAPLKDSGVEWLGQVPERWEVKRVKQVFRIINGATPSSGTPEFWDGDIFWITPNDLGDLKSDTIVDSARKITRLGYMNCGTTLAPAGSLVLSTRAPIGHLAIAGIELCTNQGCRCLVFREQDNVRYFYYQFLAARSVLQSLGQGSTFYELSKGNLESTMLVAPRLPEQRAIAAHLDRETAKIDALVAKIRQAIETLREYRTALISAAVTGKMDVR